MVKIEVENREQLEEWFTEGKEGKHGVVDMIWERIRFLRGEENIDKGKIRREINPGDNPWSEMSEDLKGGVLALICQWWGDRGKLKRFLLLSPEKLAAMVREKKSSSLSEVLQSQDSESQESNEAKQVIKILKDIFGYDTWKNQINSAFGPYDLSRALGIDVCPYCNRQYVNTVITQSGEAVVRPQIDHFYPQKFYPQFALCLYNLIPACSNCNQKKSTKYDGLLNPYIQGIDEKAAFSVFLDQESNELGYQVNFEGGDDANIHIKTLHLKELYKTAHQDHLEELIEKSDENSPYYYQHLANLLQGQGLSIDQDEFYRFVFGNYPDPKDFHRRPLAKFTHDILKDLGVDLF